MKPHYHVTARETRESGATELGVTRTKAAADRLGRERGEGAYEYGWHLCDESLGRHCGRELPERRKV